MQPGWRRHTVVVVALAALLAAAYGNSLQVGFAYDNRAQILEDARLRSLTQDNLRQLFTQDLWWPRAVSGLYRPVTKLTFLANYAVLDNGDRPLGYHLVNLGLHLLNAVLVYLLALEIGLPLLAAFWSAALFATHPVATEAVTNLIGRADLLAALAVLGGLLLYRRLQLRPSTWPLVVLAALTTFGVLAKENAAILPALMLMADLAFRRRPVAAAYVAVALPLVAVWLWRMHLYADLPVVDHPFVDNPLIAADFWTARLTAFKVFAKYVVLLVWPATLSADYAYRQITPAGWTDLQALTGLAGAAGLIVLAASTWRRRPVVAFVIGFFLMTLLPTSNLLFPIGSIMGERFLYLPLVSFGVGVALAVPMLLRQPRLVAVASAGIVLAYCGRTAIRNRDWQDSLQLWASTVAAAPESFRGHASLALARFHAQDLDGAISEGEKARAILAGLPPEQTDPNTLYELGRYYGAKADRAGVERTQWYARAADVLGEAAVANRTRGALLRARAEADGRRPEDVPELGNSRIFYHYALALMALGRYREAIDSLRWACHLSPDDVIPYSALARAYLFAGEPEPAALALLQGLEVESGNAEALALLAHAVRAVPDASCAFQNDSGRLALNPDCPWLVTSMCRARRTMLPDLRVARATGLADAVAARQAGCGNTP